VNYLDVLAAFGDLALIVILPVLVIMAKVLWGIKTNDLPHIQEELVRLGTEFAAHDKWEREEKDGHS
jgi:hypothetical protein